MSVYTRAELEELSVIQMAAGIDIEMEPIPERAIDPFCAKAKERRAYTRRLALAAFQLIPNFALNMKPDAAVAGAEQGLDGNPAGEPPISSLAGALTAEKAGKGKRLLEILLDLRKHGNLTGCIVTPDEWETMLDFAEAEGLIAGAEQGTRNRVDPPSSARERRMEEALRQCAAEWKSPPCTMAEGVDLAWKEFCRRAEIARAALSSDGRGREKGNTSNSDDGIDPTPPATNRSA